jgi:alcohol dehydrogenase (cytochrome c)
MNTKLIAAVLSFVGPLAMAVSAAAAEPLGPSQTQLDRATEDGTNWLYVDHDYHGTRYTPIDKINRGNVGKLAPVCRYTFPDQEPSQTAPVVFNGVVYATTAHHTVALDGATCKVVWQSQWTPKGTETFNTQRGAAIKDGKLVRGTADGWLIALDMATGKEVWTTHIADSDDGHFISMPPLIVDDLVLIGPAGAEWAAKGWVGAFSLKDGKPVWKFNTVPDPGEKGSETWGNDPKILANGGGDLWTPMSYDVAKGLLFVPVGNPAPDNFDAPRPGANLYTDSLVALDVHTGQLAWYYQEVRHDVLDLDLTHVAPIFDIKIGGKQRQLVATTGKDGLLRVLDRDTHQLVYSVPFTTRQNLGHPFVDAGFGPLVCPGALGGNEWNGAAYSAKSQTLFSPAADWCYQVRRDKEAPDPAVQKKKGFYFGGQFKFTDWKTGAKGWLTAFDAATGKQLWRYRAGKPLVGAVLATGGDLVFSGDLNGDLHAFDAKTGKVLFTHNVGGPLGGGLVSYQAGGEQYVASVSGYVGVYNQVAPELGGANPTITVFALAR